MQDALVAANGSAPAAGGRPESWQASYDAVQQQLRDFELAEADGLADRSVPMAVGILVRLGRGRGARARRRRGLGAGGAAGRPHPGPPAAAGSAPPRWSWPSTGCPTWWPGCAAASRSTSPGRPRRWSTAHDEIGEVGRAFNEVQRTAVQAAVDEATLRRGLNEVFLNIARRSQGLVHRQLALLDRMERRAEDPDELAELFRSTTWPPGCAGTPRTWSSWPARHRAGAGAHPVADASTWCAARSPRSRRTTGWTSAAVAAGRAARPGRRRRHPPARRADRERHRLLPAGHPGRGDRGRGVRRLRRRDQRPGPGHVRRDDGGGQPPAGRPRPSSTRPTAPGSACSWWPGWPPGTASGSPCGRTSAYGGVTALVLIPADLVTDEPPAGPDRRHAAPRRAAGGGPARRPRPCPDRRTRPDRPGNAPEQHGAARSLPARTSARGGRLVRRRRPAPPGAARRYAGRACPGRRPATRPPPRSPEEVRRSHVGPPGRYRPRPPASSRSPTPAALDADPAVTVPGDAPGRRRRALSAPAAPPVPGPEWRRPRTPTATERDA